jgi:hypothetical protein
MASIARRSTARSHLISRDWVVQRSIGLKLAWRQRGRRGRSSGDNSEPQDTVIAILRELGEVDMLIPYYVTSECKSATSFRSLTLSPILFCENAEPTRRLPIKVDTDVERSF